MKNTVRHFKLKYLLIFGLKHTYWEICLKPFHKFRKYIILVLDNNNFIITKKQSVHWNFLRPGLKNCDLGKNKVEFSISLNEILIPIDCGFCKCIKTLFLPHIYLICFVLQNISNALQLRSYNSLASNIVAWQLHFSELLQLYFILVLGRHCWPVGKISAF